MTITHHRVNDAAATARVDIWRCEDCRCFHVRAGKVLLTFTHDEFESFLRAAGRCYLGDTCAHVMPVGENGHEAKVSRDSDANAVRNSLLVSALEH
jgi:hypothetical protein